VSVQGRQIKADITLWSTGAAPDHLTTSDPPLNAPATDVPGTPHRAEAD